MKYDDIYAFRIEHARQLRFALGNLEEKIIQGRDEQGVPVYLTKYRIKSADSIFLKMKKKRLSDPFGLGDLGGLRVLCLFDQELVHTFEFLVSDVFRRFRIEKLKIFNFDQEQADFFANHGAWSVGREIERPVSVIEKKASGYRSIHFLLHFRVESDDYPIEVQLRTLLQDVWGELEHTLLYKRSGANPEIGTTFRRLQDDLGRMGEMLGEMKTTSVKEAMYDEFLMRDNGPDYFFGHEENSLPEQISRDPQLMKIFTTYEAAARQRQNATDRVKASAYARQCFNALKNARTTNGLPLANIYEASLAYVLLVEEAYCLFSEGNLRESLHQYEHIISQSARYGKKYVPHFRAAEIYFITGDIVRALRHLDEASEILKLDDLHKLPTVSLENAYRIKLKAAYIYWLLGRDYIEEAIKEIYIAERIFEETETREGGKLLFTNDDRMSLINNVCWYLLEKFIMFRSLYPDDSEEVVVAYKDVESYFGRLEIFLEGENVTSNALDTAAWFCYNVFLYRGEEEFFRRAIRYSISMLNKKNRATFKAAVALGKHQRLREISSAARDHGIWM